ncbi:hypothetical protein TRFO_12981 [Tritrichomonas foetus]|uniref:CWH43-like N-terminal domain-containing protein n=1 Tax=Tritrichomonas foetus TaxID=1144522 RepID=A0A1J4KZY8_9EUKA|nr:hypothetical protein TRFO_12981 [Tritrichomonas foetus]|eukprot:OHT16722.1 hypothetical protein TRFO_12981 [Tritrichomonas foetus]
MKAESMIIQLGSPKTIYKIASIFPVVTVLACWSIYYSTNHFRKGRIRTISETVQFFPENRIFPVAMNIEAMFLFFILVVRQKIIHKLFDFKKITKSSLFKFSYYLTSFLIPVNALGLSILADVTLIDHKIIHLAAAFTFFLGMFLYFCISDFWAKKAGYEISIVSRLIPYLGILLFIAHIVITVVFWRNRLVYSIGSIIQYTCALLIFTKIWMLAKETPKHLVMNGNEHYKSE